MLVFYNFFFVSTLVRFLHTFSSVPSVSYCCGVTIASKQQHNQDLREIYKGRRILEFITFYHSALHLTRVHCATNNSNKNTGKFASFAAQTQSFLCGKFSTARLEVLPYLTHAGVFQMSTMVNLGIGFQFKSLWLVQVLNLTRSWAFALRLRNTWDIQIPSR